MKLKKTKFLNNINEKIFAVILVILGIVFLSIYLIFAHPKDAGPNPPLTNFNPYDNSIAIPVPNGDFENQDLAGTGWQVSPDSLNTLSSATMAFSGSRSAKIEATNFAWWGAQISYSAGYPTGSLSKLEGGKYAFSAYVLVDSSGSDTNAVNSAELRVAIQNQYIQWLDANQTFWDYYAYYPGSGCKLKAIDALNNWKKISCPITIPPAGASGPAPVAFLIATSNVSNKIIYYVDNVQLFKIFDDSPDLDNCPGGPFSAKCYDPLGFELTSCRNTEQEDVTFNLKGDLCDRCGNGRQDFGEQCDYGLPPNCVGFKKGCDKEPRRWCLVNNDCGDKGPCRDFKSCQEDLSQPCQTDGDCLINGINKGPCRNICNSGPCAPIVGACTYCDFDCQLRVVASSGEPAVAERGQKSCQEDLSQPCQTDGDCLINGVNKGPCRNNCADNRDNDADGLVDCADPNCAGVNNQLNKICCLTYDDTLKSLKLDNNICDDCQRCGEIPGTFYCSAQADTAEGNKCGEVTISSVTYRQECAYCRAGECVSRPEGDGAECPYNQQCSAGSCQSSANCVGSSANGRCESGENCESCAADCPSDITCQGDCAQPACQISAPGASPRGWICQANQMGCDSLTCRGSCSGSGNTYNCQLLTANEDTGCIGYCTVCDNGSCLSRSNGDTTECPSGQSCQNGACGTGAVTYYPDIDDDSHYSSVSLACSSGAPNCPPANSLSSMPTGMQRDCNDSDPAIYFQSTEPAISCGDGKDNDCDGYADCADFDCAGNSGPDSKVCCWDSAGLNDSYCPACQRCGLVAGARYCDIQVNALEGNKCSGACSYCEAGECKARTISGTGGLEAECNSPCKACIADNQNDNCSANVYEGSQDSTEPGLCNSAGQYCQGGSCQLTSDTTPPTTTANPVGGTYTSVQNVTLTPNETATTRYCFGAGCNPTLTYTSPISLSSSNILRFYSTDIAGNIETIRQESYTINLADTVAPTVSITSPVTDAVVANTITIQASASDNVGVVGVQFIIDGNDFGTEDTTSPYSISWDTTTATNGAHTLTAEARDAVGNQTTSAEITIHVNNLVADIIPPTATLISAPNVTFGGGTTYQIQIQYSDNTAVNVSTINASDITVAGLTITSVNVDQLSNGTPRLATYTLNPPGGSWNSADNNTYTIALNSNPVADTAGRYVAANASFGSFTVNIPDDTAPAAITNLTLSNPNLTSMTLTWTAPGDDGNIGTATTYDIRYSPSAISESNWNSAEQVTNEISPAVAGTAQTMTIYGLSPNTTYYFAIKTADEMSNWSGLSNTPSRATLADSQDPSIAIVSPTTGATYTTANASIDLGGTASDNIGVVQVSWINDQGGSGSASGTTNWTINGITLQIGANLITVTARDAANNTATDILTVTYNLAPVSGNYYCDNDSDGRISSTVSNSCSSFPGCIPASCQQNAGDDCNDSNRDISPAATNPDGSPNPFCDCVDSDGAGTSDYAQGTAETGQTFCTDNIDNDCDRSQTSGERGVDCQETVGCSVADFCYGNCLATPPTCSQTTYDWQCAGNISACGSGATACGQCLDTNSNQYIFDYNCQPDDSRCFGSSGYCGSCQPATGITFTCQPDQSECPAICSQCPSSLACQGITGYQTDPAGPAQCYGSVGCSGGSCACDNSSTCVSCPNGDSDNFCDSVDPCPYDPSNDADNDGVCAIGCINAPGATGTGEKINGYTCVAANTLRVDSCQSAPAGPSCDDLNACRAVFAAYDYLGVWINSQFLTGSFYVDRNQTFNPSGQIFGQAGSALSQAFVVNSLFNSGSNIVAFAAEDYSCDNGYYSLMGAFANFADNNFCSALNSTGYIKTKLSSPPFPARCIVIPSLVDEPPNDSAGRKWYDLSYVETSYTSAEGSFSWKDVNPTSFGGNYAWSSLAKYDNPFSVWGDSNDWRNIGRCTAEKPGPRKRVFCRAILNK